VTEVRLLSAIPRLGYLLNDRVAPGIT